jgi:hypothetical protein
MSEDVRLTVEDVCEALYRACVSHVDSASFDEWSRSFISTTNGVIGSDFALTTEQSRIVLSLAKRYRSVLVRVNPTFGTDLDRALSAPRHRRPVVTPSDIRREVRYLGTNFIGFRYKRDPNVAQALNRITGLGLTTIDPSTLYRAEDKVTRVPVNRFTIAPIQEVIRRHRFHIDDPCLAYLTDVINAVGQPVSAAHGPDLGLFAIEVPDNDLVSWWIPTVLGGRPA